MSLGNFKAKCPRCRKTTFEAPAGTKRKPDERLTCTGCGHVVRYEDLVGQVRAEFRKRTGQSPRANRRGSARVGAKQLSASHLYNSLIKGGAAGSRCCLGLLVLLDIGPPWGTEG